MWLVGGFDDFRSNNLGSHDEPRWEMDAGHRVKVVEVPARKGYFHPLGPAQIRNALEFFGSLAVSASRRRDRERHCRHRMVRSGGLVSCLGLRSH